jgi:hypothetical protein
MLPTVDTLCCPILANQRMSGLLAHAVRLALALDHVIRHSCNKHVLLQVSALSLLTVDTLCCPILANQHMSVLLAHAVRMALTPDHVICHNCNKYVLLQVSNYRRELII